MLTIINNYALFKSELIILNQQQFIKDAHYAHKRFKTKAAFNGFNSTSAYGHYNLFSLTIGSKVFFALHTQLTELIRNYVGDDRELWFQCWLNYHMPHEVLKRHNHLGYLAHGYVSVDPKNTSTVFDSYTIKNGVGQIYIGPSNLFHEVVVHEPYETPRLTIGFDVVDAEILASLQEQDGLNVNLSFIPVR